MRFHSHGTARMSEVKPVTTKVSMTKIRLLIPVIALILCGCAVTVQNRNVNSAIANKDYENLKQLLTSLSAEDTVLYNKQITRIKAVLLDHYEKEAIAFRHNGELDEAIVAYEQALEITSERLYISSYLSTIVKERERINNVVTYLASDDTSGIIRIGSEINHLKQLQYSAPIRSYSYLTSKVDVGLINETLKLWRLFDANLGELPLYVKLYQLREAAPSGPEFSGHYGRLEKFLSKYEDLVTSQEGIKDRDKRISLLKSLSNIGSFDHLPDQVVNRIDENLRDFYSGWDTGRSNHLESIYEYFLWSDVFDTSANTLERLMEYYVKNRTYAVEYIITGPRNLGDELFDVIGILSSSHPKTREPGIILQVHIAIDSLSIHIEEESYRKALPSKYLVEVQVQPNPRYNELSERVSYWQTQYAAQVNALAYDTESFLGVLIEAARQDEIIKTRENLERTRILLARTPTTIEVPVYQNYRVTEIGHRIEGYLGVSISIQYKDSNYNTESITTTILEERRSYENVMPDDHYGYQENRAAVPNELVLRNILNRKTARQILQVSSAGKLSTYLPVEVFDPSTARIEMSRKYNFRVNEFLDELEKISRRYDQATDKDLIGAHHGNLARSPLTLKKAIDIASRATCQVIAYDEDYDVQSGTAYAVSSIGHYVTNLHVLEGHSNLVLAKSIDGKIEVRSAELLAWSDSADLALLRVQTPFSASEYVHLSGDIRPELGDEVLYVGYPGSPIASGMEPFLSRGIVSQVVRNMVGVPALILFDLTANPGASGSAVIHQPTGTLVGTLTWGFGRTITASEIRDMVRGKAVMIKESQNVGTSANVLISFLTDSGYWE